MALPVLVPLHSKELFEQLKNPNIKPIFYRLRQESFLQKGMRKLGLRGAGQTLAARFEFIEEGGLLGETYALWLSPAVRLPPSQMACLLDLLPKLRWVYSQITGIDHLEPGLFTARGVLVSNSGRLSSRRMAEMALATILAHAKRLPEHIAMQRRRRWTPLASSELYHQTVGIIGTGNIGNELAKLCRGIGLHVIGASREPGKFAQNPAPYDAVVSLSGDLEGLLAKADHVVLALPLNQQTRGLIGTTMLGHMKKNSSLINLARGELVVEDELCNALSKGKIGAAYIDLPAKLPLPVWSRLYRTPNLILTHNSAAKSISLLAEAFEQFLRGLEIMTQTGNPPDRVI